MSAGSVALAHRLDHRHVDKRLGGALLALHQTARKIQGPADAADLAADIGRVGRGLEGDGFAVERARDKHIPFIHEEQTQGEVRKRFPFGQIAAHERPERQAHAGVLVIDHLIIGGDRSLNDEKPTAVAGGVERDPKKVTPLRELGGGRDDHVARRAEFAGVVLQRLRDQDKSGRNAAAGDHVVHASQGGVEVGGLVLNRRPGQGVGEGRIRRRSRRRDGAQQGAEQGHGPAGDRRRT
jgi:hypothetical protein